MDPNMLPYPPASAAERRLTRLAVQAPASLEPNHRIDWIHSVMASARACTSSSDDSGT